MITFNNLHKAYKSTRKEIVKALDGFSLKISENQVFAIVGVNGAGKTTALKALFGLIEPDQGEVRIAPKQNSMPRELCFAPEVPDMPTYLTVEEVLHLSCQLCCKNIKPQKTENVLEMFHLLTERNKRISDLSKGNRQRVSLAAAVISNAEIIVLDEPISGLDPLGRQLIKQAIKDLKANGHTIIFTTHMLADLPELCDKIAIIHNGKVIFTGTIQEFCQDNSLEALEKAFAEIVTKEDANKEVQK